MAPNFFSKIILLSLSLALGLAAVPANALAAAPAQVTLKEHVIKFYLDPALVLNIAFAKSVLPKYVTDMNTVLAKNTNRRFVFDPETGIILTGTKPQSDSASSPLPTESFEIWTHALRTDRATSYGGYMSMDKSGAGVLAGFYWTQLYDPEQLPAGKVWDYSLQLNNMLHELAHVFGAGIGEYYNLASISDRTGLLPLANIALSDPADRFWSDKPDFLTDPLLRPTQSATRADYLAAVRYSSLTAAIISGDYRNGISSFDSFTLRILDENGQPVPAANIKVWNVNSSAPNTTTLLFDGFSDETGQLVLPWGGTSNAHSSSNFLRLVKVYKDGIPVAQPRYISIYDTDIARLVSKNEAYTITMQAGTSPAPVDGTTARTDTFTSGASYDGWLLESGRASNKGGSANAAAGTFFVGDDAGRRQYRSLLSFDTTSLPDNAVITKVTLRIKRQGIAGANPFKTHGKLLVDMRNGAYSNALSVQPGDFQASGSGNNIAEIANTPADGNWYTTTLNASALKSINLTGVTQFRLHFSQHDDNDKVADYLKFFSGNADAASRPALVIEYHLP